MRAIKEKSLFVCQECGYESAKWLGRCPGCGQWNSLVEEIRAPAVSSPRAAGAFPAEEPRPISEVKVEDSARIRTGIAEFDGVLGGGVVPGSVILIGGDPGIGKSTLLLQAADRICRQGGTVLYVSGEESGYQTGLRAKRLGVGAPGLYLVSETSLDVILEHIKKLRPLAVVIDSIQIIYRPDLASSPGSITQVKECAAELTLLAKASGVAIFLVGHVTKEGYLAGPKVLEHLVDTVIYFEGERHTLFRILRTMKNRFGSTNEVGVFEMTELGLKEVVNPSRLFLSDRSHSVPGSMVVPCLEGNRPILMEIQALVSPGNPGVPRRRSTGLDYNRVGMILAVLEKRASLRLNDQDVFVNVVGGMKIVEPDADLAAAIAIASSRRDVATRHGDAALGEIGLAGEVRAVAQPEIRLAELERMGFTRCLLAKGNRENLSRRSGKIELVGVATAVEAIRAALSS